MVVQTAASRRGVPCERHGLVYRRRQGDLSRQTGEQSTAAEQLSPILLGLGMQSAAVEARRRAHPRSLPTRQMVQDPTPATTPRLRPPRPPASVCCHFRRLVAVPCAVLCCAVPAYCAVLSLACTLETCCPTCQRPPVRPFANCLGECDRPPSAQLTCRPHRATCQPPDADFASRRLCSTRNWPTATYVVGFVAPSHALELLSRPPRNPKAACP